MYAIQCLLIKFKFGNYTVNKTNSIYINKIIVDNVVYVIHNMCHTHQSNYMGFNLGMLSKIAGD